MIYYIIIIGLLFIFAIGLGYYINIANADTDRKEYTFCPIDISTLPKGNYDVEGCPTVRVYVEEWNTKTSLDQTTIDSSLKASGFKESTTTAVIN